MAQYLTAWFNELLCLSLYIVSEVERLISVNHVHNSCCNDKIPQIS